MYALIASTIIAAMTLTGIPPAPAFAQNTVTPAHLNAAAANPIMVQIFNAYPRGGEVLTKLIADFIVSHPKLAPELANYVVNTPSLSKAQKIAAERGLAAALERLGINAADLDVPVYKSPVYKAPTAPPPAVVEEGFNPLWLLAAAAVAGGIVCALECFQRSSAANIVTQH